MNRPSVLRIALACSIATCSAATATEPERFIRRAAQAPQPPWPQGDERGMANAIGPVTFSRCAWHLSQRQARSYELSHERSSTMPQSPFAAPYAARPKATAGIPGSSHLFNSETYGEGVEPAAQGTQMDALGHFAVMSKPWDGSSPLPAHDGIYYGGFTQKDVKPTPNSPLLKLGMEKAPPIVTTGVLLDAKARVGGGKPLGAGQLVTAKDIEAMLKAQGLAKRGILPGDVVLVYTGWGGYWKDPDTERKYYAAAPGLSYDAAHYLGLRRASVIALDTPFIDPVPEGMLAGKAGQAAGVPAGLPFAVHHHMLTQMGIHHVENAKLDELARDKVWTSCVMILPLRERGAAGSPVRPVAIGVPRQ
jgi:kynurenine formamidase